MTGYGIEDVPNVELAIDDVAALQQEDAAQASLMAEAVIAVAEDDTVIGPMSKLEATKGLATTIVHSASCCSTPKERCCSSNGRRTRSRFPTFGQTHVVRTRCTALKNWNLRTPWV